MQLGSARSRGRHTLAVQSTVSAVVDAALREPPPLSPSLHSGPEQLAGEDCPGCGRGHLG